MSGSVSGIKLDDAAKEFHDNTFKIRKKHAYYYLVLNEKLDAFILGEKADPYSEKDTSEECLKKWKQFMDSLEDRKPTLAVFDLRYKTPDNRDATKIIFVSWVPADVRPKTSMIYGSTKDAIAKSLGVDKCFHADEKGDLDIADMIKGLTK